MKEVSYLKALDIWMFTCIAFVFMAILEYCLAQIWLRTEEASKKKDGDDVNIKSIAGNESQRRRKSIHEKLFLTVAKKGMKSNVFDETARWLFPTAFFIFGKSIFS